MNVYAPLGPVIPAGPEKVETLLAMFHALDDLRERLAAPGPVTEPPAETMARSLRVGLLDDLLGRFERESGAEIGLTEEAYGEWETALAGALDSFALPLCHLTRGADGVFTFAPDPEAMEEAVEAGIVYWGYQNPLAGCPNPNWKWRLVTQSPDCWKPGEPLALYWVDDQGKMVEVWRVG